MIWFRLKNCIKCQGDLASDEGDWICLQCGTYYYTGLYQVQSHMEDGPPAQVGTPDRLGVSDQKDSLHDEGETGKKSETAVPRLPGGGGLPAATDADTIAVAFPAIATGTGTL